MRKLFFLVALLAFIFDSQAQPSSTDRITYTINDPGFNTTEHEVAVLTQSVASDSYYRDGAITYNKPTFPLFNFTKPADINTKSINLAIYQGIKIPSIEFKIYAEGAAEPYVSYQLKNFTIVGFKTNGAGGGSPVLENISLRFENFGFKDWVNNLSYGYNILNYTLTSY
ncbi:MAG: type VI secretion system tube protein Hcp [Bacteroidota bacterium]